MDSDDDIPVAIPHRLKAHIQAGECVLFLGAGASIDAGGPTAQALSDELSEHFLGLPAGSYPLSEAAALVDAEDGRRTLNQWLVRRLEHLEPSDAIRAISTFRWKAIYTVNYDDLVEQAYRDCVTPVQVLRPFYSDKDSLSSLRPDEVAFYKLHGCITRPNSDEGRLVITQDDFAEVETSRKRLFNRLVDHVADQPLFYVGFGRADPDFARILVMVERAVGRLTDLTRSYALHPRYVEVEAKRAETKKVTLIDKDASSFFAALRDAIPEDLRRDGHDAVGPLFSSGLQTRRPAVTAGGIGAIWGDYDIIDDVLELRRPDADAFFRGSPPSWADITSQVDARRDAQDAILEAVLVDTDLDRFWDRLVLVHAEAGAGKTTLLRRVAVELATTWDRVVLVLKPFGAFDFLSFEQFATSAAERVYVIVDDALRLAPELRSFLSAARRAHAKVTILAAARTNEWRDSSEALLLTVNQEFELDALSETEIEAVINRLDVHGALGFLSDASPDARREAFTSRAEKQLLVALREATEGKAFDEIVVDEFERIPSDDAKRAYLYIAALHRFGLLTRAAVLHRAIGVPIAQLGRRVFDPATKIIVSQELASDPEPYYRTRHPLIAEIVFDRRVPSEAERLAFYVALIRELDLGYASDADTYRRLSRSLNKNLLRDFQEVSSKRKLMGEIQGVDPSDAYVHQHAAMMELSFGDVRTAAIHITEAIALRPHDLTIRDTEGRIVLAGVAHETTGHRKLAKLAEAEAIFAKNIARRPTEPYGYRHLAETYWVRSGVETEVVARARFIGMAYQVLADGLDNAVNTAMLQQYRAYLEDAEGNQAEAWDLLDAALRDRPDDVPMRVMAAGIAERRGRADDAIATLRQGVVAAPDAWELHYRLALLLAQEPDASATMVSRHFSAAMLAPARRYRPRLMYGAWLFTQGRYEQADEQFERLSSLEVPANERFEPRRVNFGGTGKRCSGRLTRLAYRSGHIEHDGGATRIFFRTRDVATGTAELRVGTVLTYDVRFNLLGPVAKNLRMHG
jgi:tetratricopeptide (TPR) repeat protein